MNLEHCASQSEMAVGPLFIRKVHLTHECSSVVPHVHPFSHVTFFMRGAVEVTLTTAEGTNVVTCEPGAWLQIPAGVEHSMRLIGDEAICACVFANRDESGQLTEAFHSIGPTL